MAPSGVPVDHDWVLDGFGDALSADGRGQDTPTATLRITSFLRQLAGDAGVPVWTRTYERQVPFATGSAGAYVTALNSALSEILAELAKDLAGASLPKP